MSAVQTAQEMHSNGLKYFYDGNFLKSASIFREAIVLHGPHLGILADLSACYYLLGNMREAQEIRSLAEKEFHESKDQLSIESKIKTLVFLSKMREENGEIKSAFSALEEALELSTNNPSLRIRVVCQLLRMTTSFAIKELQAQYYRELILFQENEAHWDIEIQHALMLSEEQLLGFSAMKARYEKLCKMQLNPQDLRLIHFDFAEVCLLRGHKELSVFAAVNSCNQEELDGFERTIREYCQSSEDYLNILTLNELSPTLSFMSYLRVLSLTILRAQNHEDKVLLRKQMILLLDSTDPASRQILLKKWISTKVLEDQSRTTESLVIVLDARSKSLSLSDKIYSFEKKDGAWKILSLLCGQESVSAEEISLALGCLHYDEAAYNRVRVALQRLNKDLTSITGVPQVLKLKDHQVSCHGISVKTKA